MAQAPVKAVNRGSELEGGLEDGYGAHEVGDTVYGGKPGDDVASVKVRDMVDEVEFLLHLVAGSLDIVADMAPSA